MTRPKPGAVLLDANLLIALAWPQHVHHELAHNWFAAARAKPWATCALTQLAFVRISSNPKIIRDARNPAAASALLRQLTELPNHVFWPDRLDVAELRAFESVRLVGHRQVTDAYLVELARANGGRVATLDGGLVESLPQADRALVEWLG